MTDQKLILSFVWIFSALTNQKIMLFSNRGKNVFEYLQASRLRPRRDILEAKDFLEDSIWQPFYMRFCNGVDETFQHHFAGVEINFFNNLPVGQVISYVCLPEEISTCPKKKCTIKVLSCLPLEKICKMYFLPRTLNLRNTCILFENQVLRAIVMIKVT